MYLIVDVGYDSNSPILIALPSPPPHPSQDLSGIPTILKFGILGIICLLSFAIRLFAVVRYESVIHEFDPYFNFRTTKVGTEGGREGGREGGKEGGKLLGMSNSCDCCTYTLIPPSLPPSDSFSPSQYLASEGFLEFLDWFDDRYVLSSLPSLPPSLPSSLPPVAGTP